MESRVQGSQQTWSCGIILRKAFKNSRQRGVYVTFESFVDHRRLQDSAVAGIHVNEGRLKDAYNYVSESGENISKSGVYVTNQEINFRVYTSCV